MDGQECLMMRNYVLIIYLLFCSFTSVSSQIVLNNWTNQYGSYGFLLGGAVVGTADDSGAAYYNPAGIGIGTDTFKIGPSLISPKAYAFSIKDMLGEGSSIFKADATVAPSFIAMSSQVKDSPWRLGIVSLYKRRIRFELQENYHESFLDMGGYHSQLDVSTREDELFVGVGASYAISDRWSLGLTQIGTYNNEIHHLHVVRAHKAKALASLYEAKYHYKVYTLGGMISKFGLLYRNDLYTLGMTYTSPLYGILIDKGSYTYTQRIENTSQTRHASNLVRTPIQNVKRPYSIALGGSIPIGDDSFFFTVEYFGAIPYSHKILHTDRPDIQTGIPSHTIQIGEEHKAIANIALAYMVVGKAYNRHYIGIRTDFSSLLRRTLHENLSFDLPGTDMYHFTYGRTLSLWAKKITLGIDIGGGISEQNTSFVTQKWDGKSPLERIIQDGDSRIWNMRTKLFARVSF